MNSRLALVTGGLGFIGRHLVRLLTERGILVRVLDIDDDPFGLPDGGRAVTVVRGSILDRDTVRAALKGVGRLYHLAANPNLWARDKTTFHEVNFLGTRLVMEEADRAGVERVVHTSTESILQMSTGNSDGAPLDESVRCTIEDMPGPYCRSKFLAEEEAMTWVTRGLPVVIVNPTLPVGPGDHHLTPPSRMLLGFLNGEFPAFLDFELNLIDVRDAALGHILAGEHGRVGERYLLGNENIRLSRLLDLLHELTGLPMPGRRVSYPIALAAAAVSEMLADLVTHRPPKAPLTGVRITGAATPFDCSKAVRELGLPHTPLRISLADAIAWLADQGQLVRLPDHAHLVPSATAPAEPSSGP